MPPALHPVGRARRIAVIEVTAVRHFLQWLCRFAADGRNEVTLYTTRPILEDLESELTGLAIRIELRREDESLLRYLRRIAMELSESGTEHCIVNTYRTWQFLFFNPPTPICVRVYNLNWAFRDTTLRAHLRTLLRPELWRVRGLSRNALTGPLVRRLMMARVDGVLFEYPGFLDYAATLPVRKAPTYYLPLTHCEEASASPKADGDPKLAIVIPGIVTESRRDYTLALDVFEALSERFGGRVELILLGTFDASPDLAARCRRISAEGRRLRVYGGSFIPPETYSGELRNADVVLAPLQLGFRFREVEERYTYSKGSGFFADSLRFAKPCLLPDTCNIPKGYEAALPVYRDRVHLLEILSELAESPASLARLKAAARECFAELTLPALQGRLNAILDDVESRGPRRRFP